MSKNKRDLRIVYMGTPEFAVEGLKTLLDNSYTIAGVLTAPDRPAGRGQKLRESDVKKFAKKHDLPVLQPTNLKDEDFLNELKALKANLQVVVAFRMLPREVWQMPEYGTFNLHASLLPEYRGAAPINWAIINGESKTGVTTFFIDDKIDTGEIILQQEVTISANENAGRLHDKLMHLGADVILKTVQLIEIDKAEPVKQNAQGPLKPAPKIHKETCRIDWNMPIDAIYNLIRGLSPYPVAWTELFMGDEIIPFKIYAAEKSIEDHKLENGTVIATKEEFRIAVKNGFLNLEEVQLAGKKRMQVKDFLNGVAVQLLKKVR